MAYVVLNCHGDILDENLDMKEAARTVLLYDNHDYQIRPDEDGNGFVLWHTDFGGGGNVPMSPTVIYSVEENEVDAENEIYGLVIKHAHFFDGLTVMTDVEYSRMNEEMSRDNEM